jgi:hypothetical protein
VSGVLVGSVFVHDRLVTQECLEDHLDMLANRTHLINVGKLATNTLSHQLHHLRDAKLVRQRDAIGSARRERRVQQGCN